MNDAKKQTHTVQYRRAIGWQNYMSFAHYLGALNAIEVLLRDYHIENLRIVTIFEYAEEMKI